VTLTSDLLNGKLAFHLLMSWEDLYHFTGRQLSIASYASVVLAIVGMSVCPSVCPYVRHTLALSENDGS